MDPHAGLTLIGASRGLQHALGLCQRVAASRATVLITGDTGAGKELLAQYLHRHSPRRDQPLVACHCATIPETLLESELFGHERGAFTGAVNPRLGLFERSNHGTLLLDEVGDIPLAAQAKLLRVIQERRFSRLGSTYSRETDVRIIATTRHDLLVMARRGQFREDLFYRLSVFPIHIAPLRQRREDIAPLAEHFLRTAARRNRCRQSGFTDTALALLISYRWPGNVRELQFVVERALLLAQGQPISEEHLPAEVTTGFMPPRDGESPKSLAYAQRLMVARALHENRWNYSQAAAQLGISMHVLRQLMHRFQLRRAEG